jgi:hypothetical protein
MKKHQVIARLLLTKVATSKPIGKVMGEEEGKMVVVHSQRNLADLNGRTTFARFHPLLRKIWRSP